MVGEPLAALIERGNAALRGGDANGARLAFEAAVASEPSGAGFEGMAGATYLALQHHASIDWWERAYAAYRSEGDQLGSIRAARSLSYLYGSVVGDWAVGGGWMARAQTLLAGTEDSVESGWVALNMGMFEGDRRTKEARFATALELARRFGDTDLELVTLAYLGASLVHTDRTDEGMQLLDEALAAVAGQEVDDFGILEEIFCQLFSACEHAHDVSRADQWIRVGEAIAARRKLPAVSAFCRTHYGGLLTVAGRWAEADAALTEAAQLWNLSGQTGLRGGALLRLADLRVRQGRFEEAEALLHGIDVRDAAGSRAAILLARGETALARDVLERALADGDDDAMAASALLALLVEVHLAADAPDDAHLAVDRLAALAERHANRYLRATAALARGRVCLAADEGDPIGCLREALTGFERAQMPMELARTRLDLARALSTERPEVALAEARQALATFEGLQATHGSAVARRLVGSLERTLTAGRGGTGLTKREHEVLRLLEEGLTNPEIAERLYISRKTVEHHVGNVLAKLGLRSRTEAATHALRAKQGSA